MEKSILDATITSFITPDNIKTYVLGTKKNGEPRALYDIVKDVIKGRNGKKKKKKYNDDFSILIKKNGKKKKKKKKKGKKKGWKFNE